ncbi:MAG: tRNA (cytidine(56)-2'-O)-methyltransferase [Candidatus Aenigmatarchaeota archaeon]
MIHVLRLGHRPFRDQRISTHCGLVARALGAEKIIYSGEHDSKLEESVAKVSSRWGGIFSISYDKNWKRVMESYKRKKFLVIHLTIYGLPVQEHIDKIRKSRDVLLVIGGEKVPGGVYEIADMNISVTNQPHSEVAALAIFIHEFYKGKELEKKFPMSKIKIIPQARGKKTVTR